MTNIHSSELSQIDGGVFYCDYVVDPFTGMRYFDCVFF